MVDKKRAASKAQLDYSNAPLKLARHAVITTYGRVPGPHGQISNFSMKCANQDSQLIGLPIEVRVEIYRAYFSGRVCIVGDMRSHGRPFNAIIHHNCPQPRNFSEADNVFGDYNYLCCVSRPECPLPHFHADGSECDPQTLANWKTPRYHRPCGCLAIGISLTCQTLYQETMTKGEGIYKYTTFMLWAPDHLKWPRLFCPSPDPKWDDMLHPNQRIFRHPVHLYIRRVSLPSNTAELLKHLTDKGWTLDKLELLDTNENPLELLKVNPTLPSVVFKLMFLLRRVKRVEVHWKKLEDALGQRNDKPFPEMRKAHKFFKAKLDDMFTDLVRRRPPLKDGEHLPYLSEFGTMDVDYSSSNRSYPAGKRSNEPRSCFPSEGCEVAFRRDLSLAMEEKGWLGLLLRALDEISELHRRYLPRQA